MKKKISKILFAAVALLLAVFAPISVSAEDAPISAMVLSPMYQKIILNPGESRDLTVKISNPNDAQSDLQYSVSVGPFSQGLSADDNTIDSQTITAYNQIMDWITLSKESGTVKPNSTDVLTFTIDVPYDAPAGGQYASILVKDDTGKNASGGSNVSIESEVEMMMIIYAEVAGETIQTGEILENNVPSFLLSNELETTSLVKNTGNVHTDAEYILQVWPLGSSEEICTNEENPEANLLMPGAERYYSQKCKLPAAGIFNVKQTVKIFGEESVVEKVVIVCPIWLLFIIFFVIAAVIIWLVMRARGRKKSARKSD